MNVWSLLCIINKSRSIFSNLFMLNVYKICLKQIDLTMINKHVKAVTYVTTCVWRRVYCICFHRHWKVLNSDKWFWIVGSCNISKQFYSIKFPIIQYLNVCVAICPGCLIQLTVRKYFPNTLPCNEWIDVCGSLSIKHTLKLKFSIKLAIITMVSSINLPLFPVHSCDKL